VRYVPAGHREQVDSSWAASDGEYLPASHSAQAAEPGELLYLPAPHASHAPPSGPVYPALHWHLALPAALPEKAGHAVHPVEPGDALYVPSQQPVHSLEPGESLYLPAPHATHAPPSGPEYPALHEHRLAASLPAGESVNAGHARQPVLPGEEAYEPAPQSSHVYSLTAPCSIENLPATQPVHSLEPGESLYLPAEQLKQPPPSFPLYPTLQVQSIKASLPAGESAFVGQLVHTAALVAPTTAEYLPPSQLLQGDGPGDALYWPAEHAVQSGSAPVNPAMHSHSAAPCSESLPSGHA